MLLCAIGFRNQNELSAGKTRLRPTKSKSFLSMSCITQCVKYK